PDPGQARHDRPPAQQAVGEPGHDAAQASSETGGSDHDVFAAGVETGRGVDTADDQQIAAHLRPFGHARGAADDDERSVDHRGARQLRLAEDHDDVVIDVAFDDGVAADDQRLA